MPVIITLLLVCLPIFRPNPGTYAESWEHQIRSGYLLSPPILPHLPELQTHLFSSAFDKLKIYQLLCTSFFSRGHPGGREPLSISSRNGRVPCKSTAATIVLISFFTTFRFYSGINFGATRESAWVPRTPSK